MAGTLALASCYEAQGRRELAKRFLEMSGEVPAMIAARKVLERRLEETDVYVAFRPMHLMRRQNNPHARDQDSSPQPTSSDSLTKST